MAALKKNTKFIDLLRFIAILFGISAAVAVLALFVSGTGFDNDQLPFFALFILPCVAFLFSYMKGEIRFEDSLGMPVLPLLQSLCASTCFLWALTRSTWTEGFFSLTGAVIPLAFICSSALSRSLLPSRGPVHYIKYMGVKGPDYMNAYYILALCVPLGLVAIHFKASANGFGNGVLAEAKTVIATFCNVIPWQVTLFLGSLWLATINVRLPKLNATQNEYLAYARYFVSACVAFWAITDSETGGISTEMILKVTSAAGKPLGYALRRSDIALAVALVLYAFGAEIKGKGGQLVTDAVGEAKKIDSVEKAKALFTSLNQTATAMTIGFYLIIAMTAADVLVYAYVTVFLLAVCFSLAPVSVFEMQDELNDLPVRCEAEIAIINSEIAAIEYQCYLKRHDQAAVNSLAAQIPHKRAQIESIKTYTTNRTIALIEEIRLRTISTSSVEPSVEDHRSRSRSRSRSRIRSGSRSRNLDGVDGHPRGHGRRSRTSRGHVSVFTLVVTVVATVVVTLLAIVMIALWFQR